ncbi:MAG TPA: PAS domain S-box protein [Planctomycetota bacterium]|nr:PAS domain S-box protein [Planctomycetota bacterium]
MGTDRHSEELRDSERSLRLLADAIPALISRVDAAFIYRFVNQAYAEWFDMPREQIVGRHMREILGDETFAIIEPRLKRALAGERVDYETTLPYKRGGQRYVMGTYLPDRSDDGQVNGIYVMVHDITERRRAEEAVAASEREFRTIFELAGSGKAQADPETGRFTRVNKRFCEITGYEEAELLKLTFRDITHPDDRAADERTVRQVVTGRSDHWKIEKRYVRKDGAIAWVVVTGTLMRRDDGKPYRTVATIHDITDRKRAEERLAEIARSLERERERLAIALRTGQMGVYEWRVGEPLVWWSPEIYSVYGVDPATFTPTVEQFSALIHPDDREELWRKTHESIERREVFSHEYRVIPPDGKLRWILNRSHVGLDASGRVERITGAAIDITERKKTEEALKEADRRKDEFLATLAHELRNPLAPIRNSIQVMNHVAAKDPVLSRVSEMIERQVQHMVRLIDDLLDVSRITRGKLQLRVERVELATVVDHAVEASRPLIDTAAHKLTVTLPPEPVYLNADPVRLAQVLSNVLNNAAKYTPRGGTISLNASIQGSHALISVKDNGIGVSREHLGRLFEPFSQVESALERSQGGLGIGLALSKGLIEMHGGSIEAHSEGPGKGSEFVVRLPVLTHDRTPRARDSKRISSATAGLRVLVVDDNEDSAESLALFLQLAGNEVQTAHDGLEAVAVAERFRPNVVLLDVGMPKLNGYEACSRIRKQAWSEGMIIIAVTGWGAEDDRQRTKDAGFDAHLTKPVDPDALSKTIRELQTKVVKD